MSDSNHADRQTHKQRQSEGQTKQTYYQDVQETVRVVKFPRVKPPTNKKKCSIKQLGIFKNTESYKKCFFFLPYFFKSL